MKRKPARHDPALAAMIAASLLLLAAIPASAPPGASVAEAVEVPAEAGAPRTLIDHLARHYRIAPEAAERTANAAYLAARDTGLDPLLVLAVIGVESSFDAAAESSKGAKGLMQIIPRYHEGKLVEHGGEALVHEPLTNVAIGARILVEYIERRGGLEAGLQSYNGARSDPSAGYAQKVMAERERLRIVAGAPAK